MSSPKIMLMGYGRHGKDTVADYLKDNYGLKSISSSLFVAEEAVYPVLKDRYNYSSLEECYNDRHNHRQEWFDLIRAYNEPDLARMAKKLFETNDIYVGIRNVEEFLACQEQKVFTHSIWVDAEGRLGTKEGTESCTVYPELCDYIIDNNGTLEELYTEIDHFMHFTF